MASSGGTVMENFIAHTLADVDLQNDATLNDDGSLIYPVAANEMIHWLLYGFYTAGAGGIQAAMSGPAAFTKLNYSVNLDITGATKVTSAVAAAWDVTAAQAAASAGCVRIAGHLHNGVNAGNVVFRWAQNVANGANTTIHEGSALLVWRISM